jgi:GT2 family glycosyltransferase
VPWVVSKLERLLALINLTSHGLPHVPILLDSFWSNDLKWKNVIRQCKATEMNHMRDVDVVSVNYNAGSLLAKSVKASLAAGARKVLVVDNASDDGSIEKLESAVTSPDLVIIRNTKNLGFSAACNIGLQSSTAGTVLFLNPDAVLGEQALSRMVEALYGTSDAGMVGGLLCNLDGTEQAGGRRAFPTPSRAFIRAFKLSFLAKKVPNFVSDFNLYGEPLPAGNTKVEAISGACMLVKREAMCDVGTWDEDYFLHCEDLDLCMRFKQKGWSILFVPNAPIIHSKGVSSQSRPIFVEWHKHRGMLRFYAKFFRKQYPNLLWYMVVCSVWLRFVAVSALVALRRQVQERSEQDEPSNSRSGRDKRRRSVPAFFTPAE